MSTAMSTAAGTTAAPTPLVVTVYLPCSSPLASNSTTLSPGSTTAEPTVSNLYYLGLILALGQSVLNGFNYMFNKMAQKRVARTGRSAAEGSFRYCCQPLWWLSLCLMLGAEGCNFAAYIFASTTVVAPMGALSVVASAVIAALFLHERMNVLGQLGAALCLVGTTLIVVFAPQTTAVSRMSDLAYSVINPVFLSYLGLVIVVNAVLIFFAYPRWGMHIPFIPITTTASMGSLTVCSSVGIGIALKRSVDPDPTDLYPWTFWFTYLIFVAITISICTQIIFLNKSLSAYNVNLVCPILYVEFTSLSILASAILYGDWSGLGYQNIIAIFMGFIVTIAGLLLISTFKDLVFGWRNWFLYLRQTMRNPELVQKELEEKAKKEQAGAAGCEPGASNSSATASCTPNVYTIEASLNAIGAETITMPSAERVRVEETTLASSFRLSNAPRQTRDAEVQLDEDELGKRKHKPDKRGFRIGDLNRFGGPRKKKTTDTSGATTSSSSNSTSTPAPPTVAAASPTQPQVSPDAIANPQLSSFSTMASVSTNANTSSTAEFVTIDRPEGFANPVFALETRRQETDASLAPSACNNLTRSMADGCGSEPEAPPLSEWQAALLASANSATPPLPSSATRSSPTIPRIQSGLLSPSGAASIEMASESPSASSLRQRSAPRD